MKGDGAKRLRLVQSGGPALGQGDVGYVVVGWASC
jgi:hypothetical protein